MRTDVLRIKKLFYKLPLIKACTVAMTIVRNAHLQGLKISWFQTGELWAQTIMAPHPSIIDRSEGTRVEERAARGLTTSWSCCALMGYLITHTTTAYVDHRAGHLDPRRPPHSAIHAGA